MELIGKTHIKFIEARNYAFLVSAVLVGSGLLSIVQLSRGHGNLGIDFAGGTSVQVRFETPPRLEEARAALQSQGGLPDAEIQEFPLQKELMVRIKTPMEKEGEAARRITEAFAKAFPTLPFTVEGTTEIGPSVGRKLKVDALWAILISTLAYIVYIGFRFELRFGVAAAAATFHDVLAVLGIMFFTGHEVNLLLITALLTLAGYSLTDTVVVFDRIRENMRRRVRDALAEVMNDSVNEVLSRTIVTSLTVFLSVLALLLLGSPVTRDFALAMLAGVVVGTYSSVFVASPIVYLWPTRRGGPSRIAKK